MSSLRASWCGLVFVGVVPWLFAPVPAVAVRGRVEKGPAPDGFGGGEVVAPPPDVMPDAQREEMRSAVEENVRSLRAAGLLPAPRGSHPLLAWPLRAAAGLTDPGYHSLVYYVDQDPAYPNAIRDYNCGIRTYDRSDGYSHMGDDLVLWPFWWYKMEHNQVEIVAAAPGTIVGKSDGYYDHNCDFSNGNWNVVIVQHADGSYAMYGHMKSGTVTSKPVGATVAEGEYLGVVGSSGYSHLPHLHFEVTDSSGALNETFQGPCNTKNADSWWQAQRPYNDSAINHLGTNPLPPVFPTCPGTEIPNEATAFTAGSTISFVAYYRTQLMGQVSQYRVRRPDASVYAAWSDAIGANYYDMAYWYWTYTNFAPTGPSGTWRFEVTYEGQTYTRDFMINVPPGAGRVPDLRVAKGTGEDVTLSWAGSCLPSDTDYEVYEGVLGDYYTHDQRFCSTGGATSITFTPYTDYEYFLVVPLSGIREGSYGTDSSGVERPAGYTPCLGQLTSGCP